MSDQRAQWSNLPGKAYRELVGRDAELSDIMAALRDPAGKWIVAIDGMGGIGKTALAREVADRCLNERLFDAVVWESAPREEFLGGERPKRVGTLTFETVLNAIGRQLGALDVPRLKGAEKKAWVQALLRSQRVLVVLDNLELAEEPQNEIARRLQPLLDPSKALLTSRHRFTDELYIIHLTGLDEDGALRLIRLEAEEKGVRLVEAAEPSILKQIARATGGSPLVLKLAVSQLRYLPSRDVLDKLRGVRMSGLYREIFFPSWQLLSDDGKKLLISMAHFAPGVGGTFEAIKATSALADDVLTHSIDELWRLSFLEVSGPPSLKKVRYYLHPLTYSFVLSDIIEQWATAYGKAQQSFIEHFLSFVQQHRSDFNALEVEFGNLLRALELCLEQKNWQPLARFISTLNDFWMSRGYWDYILRYNYILLEANAFQEDGERVSVLDQLAAVEEARGNYTEAQRLYREQLKIYGETRAENIGPLVFTLRHIVRLAKLQGDYQEARRFLERQLEIVNEHQNPREQIDVLLELAELHQKENDLDRADLLCQEGLEIAWRISYRVGEIDILRRQASIRHAQRRYQDARELYQVALAMAMQIGDQSRASEIREELTALEAAMGRDIFISYNHRDRDFVERLAHDLKAAGLKVWWDKWEIKVGDSIIQKVSEGIKQSAYLAVVLSPHSVQSPWVQRELGSALMKQLSAERDITVLPLLVADCEVPVLLREIRWADFRQDYQAGLRELLDALLGHEV